MNCTHIERAWRLGITEAEIPRRERGDIEEEEEKGWRRSRRKRRARKERRSRQSGWISLFGGIMFTRCLVTSKDGFGGRTPKPTCSQLVFPPQNSISHSQTLSGWRRSLWGRGRCSRTPKQVRRQSLQLSLSPLFHLSAEHYPQLLAITQVSFPTFQKE